METLKSWWSVLTWFAKALFVNEVPTQDVESRVLTYLWVSAREVSTVDLWNLFDKVPVDFDTRAESLNYVSLGSLYSVLEKLRDDEDVICREIRLPHRVGLAWSLTRKKEREMVRQMSKFSDKVLDLYTRCRSFFLKNTPIEVVTWENDYVCGNILSLSFANQAHDAGDRHFTLTVLQPVSNSTVTLSSKYVLDVRAIDGDYHEAD